MNEPDKLRFGPHTVRVEELLSWINATELLRFRTRPTRPFAIVSDFGKAQTLAQREVSEGIDWTTVREDADAALYPVGLLDTSAWLPYKRGIKSLLSLVAHRITDSLPNEFLPIIDDVIADLHACALCLAVHGYFDSFHGMLWSAYTFGGWPCGCTSINANPVEHELQVDTRQFYIFWKEPTSMCLQEG